MAELLSERHSLNERIKDLERRAADEQNDADLGCEEAVDRCRAFHAEACDLIETRKKLQVLIDTTQRRIELAKISEDAIEEAARPYQLAVACQQRIDLATKLQAQWEAACDTMREMQKNGIRIMQLDGSNEARRLYGLGAFKLRLGRSLIRQLVAIPSSDAAPTGGFGVLFLDCQPPVKGAAQYDKTLAQLECETLDHLPLNLFNTREQAEAACARRDPSGRVLHVKPFGDYFVVVSGELRGVAAQRKAS